MTNNLTWQIYNTNRMGSVNYKDGQFDFFFARFLLVNNVVKSRQHSF